MSSSKSHTIDQGADYPCPCRRRSGQLKPIALTEAFGCNLCQQIFVINEDGCTLEPVSTYYPYRRAWRWTGSDWQVQSSRLGPGATVSLLLVGVVSLSLLILLALAARLGPSGLGMMIGLLAIALIWLVTRRF
ncbi:MAG: hypothetical protein VKO01_05410 [Cyanobacteriota bacterium]|nr:hypothetical protein [Cyanobacteriota bacterium]